MRNFADWIGVGFWVEGKRDVKERRPAFIHRKFRGLPAFEAQKNIPTTRSCFQMVTLAGSGDIQ
jgi:hypothetical protein